MPLNTTLANISTQAQLSQEAYKNHRSGDIVVTQNGLYKVVLFCKNTSSGFSATLFQKLNSSEYTIAYRGTEITTADIKTDFIAYFKNYNEQSDDRNVFTAQSIMLIKDEYRKIHNSEISNDAIKHHLTLTGHSLGGNHAQESAYEFDLFAYTFNPFGAGNMIKNRADYNSFQYEKNQNNVLNIRYSQDWVSKFINTKQYGTIINIPTDWLDDILYDMLPLPFAIKHNLIDEHSIGMLRDFLDNMSIYDWHKIIKSNNQKINDNFSLKSTFSQTNSFSNSQNANLPNSDKNDKFTNLQNTVSNETASNSQNSQTSCHSEFLQSKNEESKRNSQILRHSESLIRHSERSEESQMNLQNIRHSEFSQESEESQINSQNTRHSEPLIRHSERSEESRKNLQNVNSQTSQNTPKWELTFTEKYVIKDFAHKLYGVKMPETKQRIGIDAATQHKISFLVDTISEHKRQIVQKFDEKTWQETFENFQKTNDLKVFENAVKSQNSNENANLKNSENNANLKNPNLQNSAGNANSENNITNPQENGNDFKM